MTRSILARVEALERKSARVRQGGDVWTVEDVVDWLDATRAEYLQAGFLVETPQGLELGQVEAGDQERGVACLLLATYDLVRLTGG